MTERKFVDRKTLAAILQEARRQGKVVVFTNGVFDLLHRGHVEYLEYARQLGDLLVVGINTDESARKLDKGPHRPLFPLEDRARMLCALEAVDYVVPFHEETPYELIRLLRPDVLVKGGDYTLDRVVGRDLVEGWGGRVVLAPYIEGYSTTQILRRILHYLGSEAG